MEDSVLDIGALLRERRQKLGYSLQDAEQHTRIRKTHLESIESNQFSDLPGKVYVTGFIRVYARYLGLDSDLLLVHLEELPQEASRPAIKATPLAMQKHRRTRKPAVLGGWSLFVLGLLVVLLLAAAVYFLSGRLQGRQTPQQKLTETVPEKTPIAQESAPSVPGQRDLALPTESTEKTGAAGEEGGAPVLEPGAPPAAAATEALQGNSLPAIPAGGASLRMLALAEGSLIINLDERSPHEYKLYNGLDLIWKVKQRALVELGAPGMARFWLDGEELDLGALESFQLKSVTGE